MIRIIKRKYLSLKFIDDWERFLRRTRFLQRIFIACKRSTSVRPSVRACVRACVLACMRAWAKYRKVRTIFSSSSISPPPPPPAPPFSPSFSSSRKPLAGSERSSSPAAINLFRDELSRSSSPSLGLAILRFCDSSKEHPLGISAKSRRRRNCHAIQSYW